jgi:transcriptional regulator with XRE-family HTH domain
VAAVRGGDGERRPARVGTASPLGTLLKQWRERRRMSQLSLALEAEISTRHLSFLETGRAQPSREMLRLLARTLEIPLRGRNELLTAAGYAPIYHETALDAPELAQARRALEFMLRQQEPYPAIVLDRHWNILKTNDAMGRVMGLFLDPGVIESLGPPNAMRLSYHPKALRPFIANWEAVAAAFIQWLHRDFLRTGDAETRRLLDELLSYPDVPRQWQSLDLDASTAPFLVIDLAKGDTRLQFFTLLASLGTPYDITLHELRIECFFPADEATEQALTKL